MKLIDAGDLDHTSRFVLNVWWKVTGNSRMIHTITYAIETTEYEERADADNEKLERI